MYNFSLYLYDLLTTPSNWTKNKINSRDPYLLTFAGMLILAVSTSQFISMFAAARGMNISLFAFILLSVIAFGVFFSFVFLEGAITSFFLKRNGREDFSGKEVFLIVAFSYYPYLFLTMLAIFASAVFSGLYPLFYFIIFIWMLITRKKLIDEFEDQFNLAPWLLVFIPVFFHMIVGFLLFIFVSSMVMIVTTDIIFSLGVGFFKQGLM